MSKASNALILILLRWLKPGWIRPVLVAAGVDPLTPPRNLSLPPGKRLMVIAPHPDDESLGCGGLIAKWCEAGREARVVFLSDGESGGMRSPGKGPRGPDRNLAAVRRAEALIALDCLGGPSAIFLGFPDGALAAARDALNAGLEAALRHYRPDTVALPFVIDRHPDHTIVTPCLLAALSRLIAAERPVTFIGYETWSPLHANTVVDISAQLERKVAAISAHRSQTKQRDYADAAVSLSRYRAFSGLVDSGHAEAFWIGSERDLISLAAQVKL